MDSLALTSSVAIWKSRISWRIALAVFLTILTVQATILNFTLKDFEAEKLEQLKEIGRAAIVPSVEAQLDPLSPPLEDRVAARLTSTTIVTGMTVYSPNYEKEGSYNLIQTAGQPTTLTVFNEKDLYETYRSHDGNRYEVVYAQSDLGLNYVVVARLDSSDVQGQVFNYVKQTIVIMLLMSGFVTTVLMMALGHWLLEPILFMRNNLMAASANPEDPDIPKSRFDPGDEIGGAIAIAQKLIWENANNIKQIKSKAEDKIHKLAYFDNLTGLPNRTRFLEDLAKNFEAAEAGNKTHNIAVVTVDLDHFKDVNDSMGHNVGDLILQAVGKRLRKSMPESMLVSRTGEDEFALTAELKGDMITAKDVGEKVLELIRGRPFKVFNEEFGVRASVGVATFPHDGTEPDQLLKNADIALNRAKEEGRDCLKEYSEDFDRAVQQRFQILRDLRDALNNDGLSLHYQPQFDLKTGEIIGAEALIRWWKPDNSKEGGRYISPVEFIPIAEQSGLVVPLGQWVLKKACETAMGWREKHGYKGRIAVNVSGVQFLQSDLVKFVSDTLEETKIDPKFVELEVTESVFMDDIQHTIKTLNQLHALGVELAIDDFGTGYSSLSYLRQFPVDRLKVDRSFVVNALNNADDAAITKTIIMLGHSLNLSVIAEGVETKEHELFLKEAQCDEVQGFRYSKPVPDEEFAKLLDGYNGNLDSFDKFK